jgi:hypothetical protein
VLIRPKGSQKDYEDSEDDSDAEDDVVHDLQHAVSDVLVDSERDREEAIWNVAMAGSAQQPMIATEPSSNRNKYYNSTARCNDISTRCCRCDGSIATQLVDHRLAAVYNSSPRAAYLKNLENTVFERKSYPQT